MATFGLTSQGGDITSIASVTNTTSIMAGVMATLPEAGTLSSLHANLSSSSGTQVVDVFVGLYLVNGGGANSHTLIAGVERLNLSITVTKTWFTFTAAGETLAAGDYILAVVANGEDAAASIYITRQNNNDSSTAGESTTGVGSYATRKSEDPWTATLSSATDDPFSLYATYTATAPNSDLGTLSNEDHITTLAASTSSTAKYLSDQLTHKLGTTRRSEILGKIGDDGKPFETQLNEYIDSL